MICKNTCIKKEDVYYHVICLQSNPLLLDSELDFQVRSGLKCTLSSIPPFHPVLPSSYFSLIRSHQCLHLCPEMHAAGNENG